MIQRFCKHKHFRHLLFKKKEAFPSLRVQKRVWQLIPKKKSLATGELSENSSTLRFEEPNVREIWRR